MFPQLDISPNRQKGQPETARALSRWSNRKRTRGEGEATPHMLVTTGPFGRIRNNKYKFYEELKLYSCGVFEGRELIKR